MDVQQARQDAKAGRLSMSDLLDMLEELDRLRGQDQEKIRRLIADIDRLKQRLSQYEPEVKREATPDKPATVPPSVRYSLADEEKRRGFDRRRHKKKSPGRRPTEIKFAEAERFEDVVPDGLTKADCDLVRERAVWRLIDGRAVRVGYQIYRGPGRDEPAIPGVPRRCEYGIEILVVLAYLVYVIGISQDKARAVLRFFCGLPLSRSQADALLRQLAKHWEAEFDTLCHVLIHAAVVNADETGWKVGTQKCSLWTFVTKWLRLFKFGCHKDADTLASVLPPDLFDGIMVSDDAAVYLRFKRAQKCWAHLLRKAIRLALLYPRKATYRRFLDELLQLYYDAKRASADQRLGESGRKARVADLEGRLAGLCMKYSPHPTANLKPHERDFANLTNELSERLLDETLFTFVLEPDEVEPTNNNVERLQRGPAQDRKVGRTSKTAAGAERRSVIVSILETLRANLPEFTFASVVAEVRRWMDEGVSLLDNLWQATIQAELAVALDSS